MDSDWIASQVGTSQSVSRFFGPDTLEDGHLPCSAAETLSAQNLAAISGRQFTSLMVPSQAARLGSKNRARNLSVENKQSAQLGRLSDLKTTGTPRPAPVRPAVA